MTFEEIKKKAFKLGKVDVDTDISFLVRLKLPVYSKKRFRGFMALSGVMDLEKNTIITVSAGFIKDGKVPFAFPLLHTFKYEAAMDAFKRKPITKLLHRVNDL